MQKVTSEEIVAAYQKYGSVWKAAKSLGLCGQSVWERLKKLGHTLVGERWTDEEHLELKALAGTMAIGEISKRLGRPYGTVATKISNMGLAHRRKGSKAAMQKKNKYDASAVAFHIAAIDCFDGPISRYCIANGIRVDGLVKAIQRENPTWWDAYVFSHTELPTKKCGYCERDFFPTTKKQVTCCRKCQGHLRSDKAYFGGKRKSAVGMSEGVCQLCREQKDTLSAHHIYGKENDPENDHLIALCFGCHHLVGILAGKKFVSDSEKLQELIALALCRRACDAPHAGVTVYVEIENHTPEEI